MVLNLHKKLIKISIKLKKRIKQELKNLNIKNVQSVWEEFWKIIFLFMLKVVNDRFIKWSFLEPLFLYHRYFFIC